MPSASRAHIVISAAGTHLSPFQLDPEIVGRQKTVEPAKRRAMLTRDATGEAIQDPHFE
jgi:hypothetical protein